MGFQEVASLDCDNAIQLGGIDRKTGKAHPTKLEGYFIGSREIASAKSKTGFSKLHIFQTQKGTVGIWGKTDLDRKLAGVSAGAMTRVTYTGTKETKNNPMYCYKVEVDKENTIDVGNLAAASNRDDSNDEYGSYEASGSDDYVEESDVGEEEAALDEVPPTRPVSPRKAATSPNAVQQARVQALLNGRGKSSRPL